MAEQFDGTASKRHVSIVLTKVFESEWTDIARVYFSDNV